MTSEQKPSPAISSTVKQQKELEIETCSDNLLEDFPLDYSLTKSQRLLNARDFQHVFSDPPLRASHQFCLILAKPNGLAHSRLGLVIAKKHIRLAVHRNRIKRIIRESFRQQRHNVAIDAIVLARRGFGELDNPRVAKIMGQQWLAIQKKANNLF